MNIDKNHKLLIYLASLWAMASYPAKAQTPENFDYRTMTPLGKIQDMVLSSDNKMFALKTTGAKIGDAEYPIWVGNSSDLASAFSSSWMTNAAPSCAFFKDKLYVAPKAETNHLYRADVGKGQFPRIGLAELLKFDPQGDIKMQAPYLYATANHLYAIEDTSNGVRVHALNENQNQNDNQSLSRQTYIDIDSLPGKPIQKAQIKDIVSKNMNGEDCLYILTTNSNQIAQNGNQRANLWLVNTANGQGQNITPNEWLAEIGTGGAAPLFDHTTSIAVHGDKLLSANANLDINGLQHGYMAQINPDGTLDTEDAVKSTIFLHSDTFRTSAIGSDQSTYYAEAINQNNANGGVTSYYFQKGSPLTMEEFKQWWHLFHCDAYSDRSAPRQGEPVHKFTTQKKGEIFAISPSRIYHIKD